MLVDILEFLENLLCNRWEEDKDYLEFKAAFGGCADFEEQVLPASEAEVDRFGAVDWAGGRDRWVETGFDESSEFMRVLITK